VIHRGPQANVTRFAHDDDASLAALTGDGRNPGQWPRAFVEVALLDVGEDQFTAGELQRRGHQVRVLGHGQQGEVVASAGLKFVAYRRGRPWSPTVAATGVRFLLRFLLGVFTELGIGDDVRDELTREPVDLALIDSMTLAGLRTSEAAGVPTVVLMHTLHRYHTHAWSRGPIGVVAAVRGMRPGRLWNAADRLLVATDSGLDPAAEGQLA